MIEIILDKADGLLIAKLRIGKSTDWRLDKSGLNKDTIRETGSLCFAGWPKYGIGRLDTF